MRIFRHTALEPGMWRGWLKNDQSLEITWPTSWRRGWSGVGLRVLIHSNDCDQGNRMLNVALGFGQAFIPLGIVPQEYQVGEEPIWGIDMSREFGIRLCWGRWSRWWDWPFRLETLSWQYEAGDGTWRDVRAGEDRVVMPETHPYSYTLDSGEIQEVEATIYRQRWVIGRRILHRLGWPKIRKHSIDIHFSAEVGERAGSWKGGCIGCSYDMLPGETPEQTLRRMEQQRRFD
ncbi:hypothetical protein SAMN04244548_02990 [Paracoccus pantotrophus]|nr:hypothetical protein SAMN04244548_02990 [Paracoccus pantotrophus]